MFINTYLLSINQVLIFAWYFGNIKQILYGNPALWELTVRLWRNSLSIYMIKIAQIFVALCNYNVLKHIIFFLILMMRKVRLSKVMWLVCDLTVGLDSGILTPDSTFVLLRHAAFREEQLYSLRQHMTGPSDIH